MARLSVWIPDELHGEIKTELGDVNVSRVLREGLHALLGCRHDDLACSRCGADVHREDVTAAVLSDLYADIMAAVADATRRGNTVEGVGRRVREIGRRYGVTLATLAPLPALTADERRAAREAG